MTPAPLPDSYWVVEDLLLAGAHPGPFDDNMACERLGRLLAAGIRLFVDLTEPGEVPTYELLLRGEAAARGVDVEYVRAPIRDRGVPSDDDLAEVLATLAGALAAKRPAYVHCWGGIGRTGTVIGCWLAQSGCAGDAALERLAELRATCPSADWRSPETGEQREMVRRWSERST